MTARARYFGEAPPASRNVNFAGEKGAVSWWIAEETPVAFIYNRRNYAVMLATPTDIEDFAIGFSLAERVVDAVDQIEKIDIHQNPAGIEIRMMIGATQLERFDVRQKRRNMAGRAGCGLCGLESADVFFETLPRVASKKAALSVDALRRALASFPASQKLNQKTHSVHGAAWASLEGEIRIVREDVGRHNAMDKLLGALSRANAAMEDGFVLMSSRCSYEIVEKAARCGVRAVAAISGPTAFAVRKAAEANIAVYVRSGKSFLQVCDDASEAR